MNNTENVIEYTVTECAVHGSTFATDRASFVAYVEVALSCAILANLQPGHAAAHAADTDDCWHCCGEQVIDPDGILD